MRYIPSLFTACALGVGVVPAAAQTAIEVVAPAPKVDAVRFLHTIQMPGGGGNPADVVSRILSFDSNADNRITSGELPERMQDLVQRHDQDGDGVLARDEVTRAVDLAFASSRSNGGSPFRIKTVTLADVVSDLRLPQPKHDLAIALAKNYAVPRNVNNPQSLGEYDLLGRMRELLDDEEYDNFVAAAARGRSSGIGRGVVGGVVAGVR